MSQTLIISVFVIVLFAIIGIINYWERWSYRKENKKLEEPLRIIISRHHLDLFDETTRLKDAYAILHNTERTEFEKAYLNLRVLQKKRSQPIKDALQQLSALLIPLVTLMPMVTTYTIEILKGNEAPTVWQPLLLESFRGVLIFLVSLSIVLFIAFIFNTNHSRLHGRILAQVNIHLLIAEEVLRLEDQGSN